MNGLIKQLTSNKLCVPRYISMHNYLSLLGMIKDIDCNSLAHFMQERNKYKEKGMPKASKEFASQKGSFG